MLINNTRLFNSEAHTVTIKFYCAVKSLIKGLIDFVYVKCVWLSN